MSDEPTTELRIREDPITGKQTAERPQALSVLPEGDHLAVLDSAEHFASVLELQRRKRDMLKEFIRAELKEGVDYGTYPPARKPSLLKPGSEKIGDVLRLRSVFERDDQVIEMLGTDATGWICLKCVGIDPYGRIIAEGRGAAGPEPTKNGYIHDPNWRIKLAQKRAQIDMILRVAALSGRFTQDIENMPPEAFGDQREDRRRPPERTRTPRGAQEREQAGTHVQGKSGHWTLGPKEGAACEVKGKDQGTKKCHGVLHFGPDELPRRGRSDESFYAARPTDPDWKRKEPWLTWAPMNWSEIAKAAYANRLGAHKEGRAVTQRSDPLLTLLADRFWTFTPDGMVSQLAEQACALDHLVEKRVAAEVQGVESPAAGPVRPLTAEITCLRCEQPTKRDYAVMTPAGPLCGNCHEEAAPTADVDQAAMGWGSDAERVCTSCQTPMTEGVAVEDGRCYPCQKAHTQAAAQQDSRKRAQDHRSISRKPRTSALLD